MIFFFLNIKYSLQFCPQQLESTAPVLKLSPFFSTKYTDSSGLMEKINGCLHLVDILPCIIYTRNRSAYEKEMFFTW